MQKRKIFSGVTILMVLVSAVFMGMQSVVAGTDDDVVGVNLQVDSTITITCPVSISMSPITGTGQSTVDSDNEATCNIKTNNSAGYKLEWAAATTYLENANSDQIAAYTPGIADTPEVWSVGASVSEWGARLKSTSTDTAAEWDTGNDGYSGKWLNVATSARQIVSRATETVSAGSDEIIQFGAEVGSAKFQPTGTYDVDVTMTATAL